MSEPPHGDEATSRDRGALPPVDEDGGETPRYVYWLGLGLLLAFAVAAVYRAAGAPATDAGAGVAAGPPSAAGAPAPEREE